MTDELGGTALLDEPAGTMSFIHLSAYIPIAGEQHGCMRDFAGEDADQSTMVWPSIEALIDDAASAVERSEPCFGWLPVINDGAVDWELP